MLLSPPHLDLSKLSESDMISKLLSLRFIFIQETTKSSPLRHSFFLPFSHGKTGHVTALCINIGCGYMLTLPIRKPRVLFSFKPSLRFCIHLPSYLLEIFMNALYIFGKKL